MDSLYSSSPLCPDRYPGERSDIAPVAPYMALCASYWPSWPRRVKIKAPKEGFFLNDAHKQELS